jgi:GNAT superfamily N-acetyltransferase
MSYSVDRASEKSLENPVWHALETRQRGFGIFAGDAGRFEPEVAPFIAVRRHEEAAFEQAAGLVAAGEMVFMTGERPLEVGGLTVLGSLPCLQMVLPEDAELATAGAEIGTQELKCANAEEMVELTTVAFPGLFKIRTCEMGRYYGVRVDGKLVAMAGERMKLDRYIEISGVCTRPGFTGRGYAAALISRLVWEHRRDGWISCLHVAAANSRAVELYKRLGFVTSRELMFHRLARTADRQPLAC